MASVTKNMKTPQQLHIPVLLDAVLKLLAPKPGQRYLDLTAGYGGHASSVIAAVGDAGLATLVDRDRQAITHLADLAKSGARLIATDFLTAAKQLQTEAAKFDMILLDLGVSSPQLDEPERGFSFRFDGPLDMCMNQTAILTAQDIVNRYSARRLSQIIVDYGEEPPRMADKIGMAIVKARRQSKITTTRQLADIVANVKPRRGKIHPATRTFQAIRIAVNDELGQLEQTLPILPSLLNEGGRLAIISFHSLEDRLVKQFFNQQRHSGFEAELAILTRRPLVPDNDNNPRARSAKLRAAAKINKNRKE
jgi:16S rRNA (cytosine1402-N4)-methyltransferase